MSFHLHAHQEVMTTRARVVLGIASAMCLILAEYCIFSPHLLSGPAFNPAKWFGPLWVWGLGFLTPGIVCAWANYRSSIRVARFGLALAAIVTAMWAAAFIVAAVLVGSGAVGALFACVCTALYLTMLPQPMRAPFEPIIKGIQADAARVRREQR